MKLLNRHLKIFYKDPMNWIISGLSVVIILSLYFLFIRDFTIQAIVDSGIQSDYTKQFVDMLMVSGLLIVISATTCLPIASLYVKDKENGILKDFLVSPISKWSLIHSYIIAGSIISFFITVLTLIVILIVLKNLYSIAFSLTMIQRCILCIMAASYVSSVLLIALSLFFHRMTAFTSFGNLFGVMIGFLTGVYIPIGYYPSIIQSSLFAFPLSLLTSLFRYTFTKDTFILMCNSYPPIVKEEITKMFGIEVYLNGNVVAESTIWIYILLFIVLLYGILFIVTQKNK